MPEADEPRDCGFAAQGACIESNAGALGAGRKSGEMRTTPVSLLVVGDDTETRCKLVVGVQEPPVRHSR